MASWYKDLLTNASTNITKLQRTYFSGDTDGDTEDDTHVCRVLRNYYTEKGQPFPGWLPPDPKAPPPVQPVYASSQSQIGSRYGGLGQQQQGGQQQGGGSGSKLNSLWDNNGPASLRQGRGGGQGVASAPPQARNPFTNRLGGDQGSGGVQPRPLPSQRSGSYQTTTAGSVNSSAYGRNDSVTSSSAASISSGTSAQEKLKQRLWGGARTTSPAAGGPFQPPAAQQQSGGGGGSRWGGSSGGGGGGDYEDRFGPGGMYDGGGGTDSPPVMSANAPWLGGGGYDYSGGGGGGGGRTASRLPSNPRRTGGLPSGPRSGR
ncbi:Sec1-binding region of Mso1-domain-containing protein [Apodospora peruviana]|uniref:Sec1-binding region of Mso1-domain-containing protein n=1 Tax=Apodospora peruviana TaxID=516989 RepID=A0AAE0IJV7_9PEZI|nr:Sec1-binding region of Mso1-domain-containing protein [Apodospora peruviana]